MKHFNQQSKYKDLPTLVKQYQVPDHKKATIQILNSFLPFIAIWVAMYWVLKFSFLYTLALGLLNGFFMARIFIIQHDCGHQSFTASRTANNIIGAMSSFLTFIPFKYWAKSHNFHHGHNGILWEHRDIGDINTLTVNEFQALSRWKKLGYMIFRSAPVMFGIVPMVYIFFNNRLPMIKQKGWENANRSLWLNNVLLLLIHATIIYFLGWKAFLMVHFPIVLIFGSYAFWFFYIQHQHEGTYKAFKDQWDYLRASMEGSSYYKIPRIWHWLTGNIGYHHIHHLNSMVPNYQLPRCHHENPIFDKLAYAITFKESLRCMFLKLWDEEKERMITWREYFEMKKEGFKKVD
jgi:acyl-lipid omega-6 desaturase (Delta-12 desaturase)